jgi:ABC-type lipoprotein export system ATPase subunit
MPAIDVVVKSNTKLSMRARQVCGMFDCPPEEKQEIRWKANLPIEDKNWNIGLIVGPSGSGKTTVAKHMWPEEILFENKWDGDTVIDCFESSIEDTADALSAVGFSTIPAWLRPYHVLSNGEKFRVDMARRIVSDTQTIVVDEFTSVVDRQVAQVASHCIQKYVRKANKKMVAVSCHDDIIEWLQPEWVFRPGTRSFEWRSVQPRPAIDIEVGRISREAWPLFAPFHYLTAKLHVANVCFGIWVNGNLAGFLGVLHRPHAVTLNFKAASRTVILPDYQGLGLAFILKDTVASAYTTYGYRFRCYPAHPAYVRAHKPENWRMTKRSGTYTCRNGKGGVQGNTGSRPNAVFEYVGKKMPIEDARRLLVDVKPYR